jgi:hypothetical protein
MITGAITEQCKEELKAIRGIPAAYRMTNKEIPTKASAYVPQITSHLRHFLQKAAPLSSDSKKKEWSFQVLAAVTEK